MFIKSCILNMYTVLFLSFPVFLSVIISCLVPVLLPVFFFCLFLLFVFGPALFFFTYICSSVSVSPSVYMWSCSLVCMFVL